MSILDPSDSDKDPKKKPRFRQDLIAFGVFFVAVIGYLIYELIF